MGSEIVLSVQALKRMPYYLQYLRRMRARGMEIVTATMAAAALKLNEVQVRKDFAAVCPQKGKPRMGFPVIELIESMELFLGYKNVNDAVLVGAGALGQALMGYDGFAACGVNIAAAFDIDAARIGQTVAGRLIYPMTELLHICRRLTIRIGVITVPDEAAQAVCESLVAGGVLSILNFTAVKLDAPAEVLIQNENIAASLALLSKHVQEVLYVEAKA